MKIKISQRDILLLLIAAIIGGVSGGVVARTVPMAPPSPTPVDVETPTSTEPVFIRIEPAGNPSLVPPKALVERASPVAVVYRKPVGTALDARTLDAERELARAVSLTSDGWFVTASGPFQKSDAADLTLWIGDRAYAADRVVRDRLNDAVFIKTSANDLPSPIFGNVELLLPGTESWMERDARAMDPAILRTVHLEDLPASQSSEVTYHRYTVAAAAAEEETGSPLWDPRGALLGIVAEPGGTAVILPSNTIASSFASLLAHGEIRHASLGVTVRDLSAWRIDGDRGEVPARGAWVLSVAAKSPAAEAGIRKGDVILQVERDMLDGTADLGERLAEFQPGSEITVRILRDGEEMTLPVILGTEVTSSES